MQYHLDTIPVWEAMEQHNECPLCVLSRKAEATEIERSLGGSVMEPESRIRVNEQGICRMHHHSLFLQQNRLGHALLTDSHAKEVLKKLSILTPTATKNKLFFRKSAASPTTWLAQKLESLIRGCVICEAIETHVNRYLYTFIYLWKKDSKFKALWESSKAICIPHAIQLLRSAAKQLSPEQEEAFAQSLLSLLQSALCTDEKDLEWFTLKFDYRNQDKPWGNSKDALERTVNLLRGYGQKEEK